ncbi:hypothetical protein [Salisediminibacterium halotolerans]|uniref:hypothetical protein n=1 Tax=Salisediminibacterium halotolerans TaxID=517425 RepID=UPI000EB07320|nr:hypothetical protein [Salisediminibacterium halotolerans]RLJ78314.1 hypothetical protein BCL39_0786 [Actinophytocola xinjiangensis]RPE88347.1 hypothetical protein EDD67_0673 [Salisediminibacterium halotolerans]TWG37290.1 hypothetical protein BCL52_0784 [Salisediminibacterium halotolerans]GEL08754.1 hypothetical protein SHA02_21700 [Salisediminibacterium halotolerans]
MAKSETVKEITIAVLDKMNLNPLHEEPPEETNERIRQEVSKTIIEVNNTLDSLNNKKEK